MIRKGGGGLFRIEGLGNIVKLRKFKNLCRIIGYIIMLVDRLLI